MKATQNRKVRRYLYKLSRALKHIPEAERKEITNEIESHIEESWQTASNGQYDNESLNEVLKKLGTNDELAKHYCEQRGFQPPKPTHTLRNVLFAIVVFVLTMGFFTGYLVYKISVPLIDLFSKKGSLVKIDDNGISAFGGAVEINDEGIKIGGHFNLKNTPSINKDEKHETQINEKNISIPHNLKKVTITNPVGDTTVIGIKRTNVHMGTAIHIKNESAQKIEELFKNVQLTEKIDGEELIIKINYPEKFIENNIGFWTDIILQIPDSLSLEVESASGKISINGLKGSIIAESASGDVMLIYPQKNINVQTTSGDIEIKTPKDYEFTFDGKTVAGDIEVDFPATSNEEGNNVKATIGKGTYSVVLKSASGEINMSSK